MTVIKHSYSITSNTKTDSNTDSKNKYKCELDSR